MSAWVVEPAGPIEPALWVQWDRLVEARFGSHPLLLAGFAGPLLESFGQGREQLCWLDDGKGEMRAAVWLQRQPSGCWTSFLPPAAQLSLALVDDPVLLESLFESLPLSAFAIDLLCQDSDLIQLDLVNPASTEVTGHVVTTSIPLEGSFDEFWQQRSSHLRKNLRRYERKTQERSLDVQIICLHGVHEVLDGLRRYGELERRGWKGHQGTAMDPGHRQYRLFEQVLGDAALEGRALVYELCLNNQLAASRLLLLGGDRVVILKTTYDEELAELAPGRQLLKAVIEDLFRRYPGRVLEFYTNADSTMLMWAAQSRQIVHVRKYRNVAWNRTIDGLRQLRGLGRSVLPARKVGWSLRQGRRSAQPGEETLSVQCHVHPREFPRDVATLMEQAGSQRIESGNDWYSLLVDHALDPVDQPLFYVLRRGEQVLAVLPLMLTPVPESIIAGMQLEALSNFYTSLYSPVLRDGMKIERAELTFLFREVRRAHRGVARWQLSPLDPQASSYSLLMGAMQDVGFITFSYFRFGNWFEQTRPWPEYWRSRDGRMRNTIERKRRKLLGLGAQIEIITEPGERLEAGIAGYLQVYSQSWKRPEPYPAFVPNLMRCAADRGWLRLGVVWLNGQAVAAQIWLVAASKASIFKLAYDEANKELSAGSVLTASLMQHVFEIDQVLEVDYLIGDDAYKEEWMSFRRERRGLLAFEPSSLLGLTGLLAEMGRRLVKMGRGRRKLRLKEGAAEMSVLCFSDIDSLPADALQLMETRADQGSYHGPAWFRNLQDTVFDSAGTVSYYVLQRQGVSVLVLPIRREHALGRTDIVALANYYTPLFSLAMVPTLRSELLGLVLQRIRDDHPRLRAINFAPLSREEASYGVLLQALRQAKFRPFEFFCFINRYLASVQSWTEYLTSRKASLRSTLKRMSKRFEAEGGHFQLITQPQDVDAGLAAYERVYASSWKRPEPFARFIPGLLRTYAARGELRLGIAWLKDQPVAAQIWLSTRERAEIHKVAYDEAFKQFSPGTLLTGFLLQQVIDQDKVKEVDYLIGDDEYKRIWMNAQRERWGIIAYNTGSFAGILGWLREVLGRTVKSLLQRWRRRNQAGKAAATASPAASTEE